MMKTCECGCGEMVGNRFVVGHQIRVSNPMWDSEVVKKNHVGLIRSRNDSAVENDRRRKIGEASKRHWANPEYVVLMKKNAYENKDWLERQRAVQLVLWKNKEYQCKQQIARMLRPNKAEAKLLEIILEYNRDFNYVGDMSYFIDGKNPDFVNLGSKEIIELFGEEFHKPEEERERIKFFNERGWNCMVIWYLDLMRSEERVRERLERYCND